MIEERPLVVDRAQMFVRVIFSDDLADALEIRLSLVLERIPLIRQRPPDITIRAEPRND